MNQSEYSQGVSHVAKLPLSWTPMDVITEEQVSQWMHAALAVLRALAVLETQVSEQDKDLTSLSGKATERLEAKLDLSLVLLMQLTRQSGTLPPCHQITLRADSVEWATGPLPEPGQNILLTLYLNAGLPIALTLPAKAARGSDSSAAVRAIFSSLDEDVDEWLSRTLFRYHRRQIQLKHDQKDRG
ncbi:MAG: PilZ domain-containing protein [Sulfuricellaceae bacterium]|nr:PilZ domain-containing protein [Sulfuricellaceae bacterium]